MNGKFIMIRMDEKKAGEGFLEPFLRAVKEGAEIYARRFGQAADTVLVKEKMFEGEKVPQIQSGSPKNGEPVLVLQLRWVQDGHVLVGREAEGGHG